MLEFEGREKKAYFCTAANRVSRAASSARSFSPQGLLCFNFLASCLNLTVFNVPLTRLKRIPANQNLAEILEILCAVSGESRMNLIVFA